MQGELGSAPSVWSLHDSIAQLSRGPFAGALDVARPHVGLHQPAFDHADVPCTFLCVSRGADSNAALMNEAERERSWWPLPVAESYVRGNDLVATYAPSDTWPYSPQVYWRANTLQLVDGVLGSLSLLLSVQTHLLDTHPQINVASQIQSSECMHMVYDSDGAAEVDRVDAEQLKAPGGDMSAVLYRLQHGDYSYVEIVRATDNRGIDFRPTPDGKLRAEWQLFADFLEKGVIRRAHVHGALLPRENDIELSLECCRAIEQSPLPLTS
jgi:hypothetical protein